MARRNTFWSNNTPVLFRTASPTVDMQRPTLLELYADDMLADLLEKALVCQSFSHQDSEHIAEVQSQEAAYMW